MSACITQLSDKCFYAAKITQRDPVQTGKWTVIFEDGQSRSLVEEAATSTVPDKVDSSPEANEAAAKSVTPFYNWTG